MRKLSINLTAIGLTLLLLTLSIFPAFAEGGLTVNGEAKAQKGDKVKLTLSLADANEDIVGYELRLFYDPELLAFDKDSFNAPQFEGSVVNEANEGIIYVTWSDISYPAKFTQKSEFLSCDFEVLGEGDTELSYFVIEMYGESMFNTGTSTHLTSYTFTYDLAVNDENQLTDGVLPVSTDPDTLANHQGGFINYSDGKGEVNSPLHGDEHKAVVGSTNPPSGNSQEPVNVTRDGKGGIQPFHIFLFIGIPLFIILIIVAVIFVKKNKNSEE